MILAGDIGGTKTVVGLFKPDGENLQQVEERVFPSGDYPSMEAILSEFQSAFPDAAPKVVCLGVAGPVIEGHCRTTNLPWELDEAELADQLEVSRVKLLNDLEATAFGTRYLKSDRLVRLDQTGIQRPGNVAVIAAGTGLGEAMLYWDGDRYHPIASEGGHVEFGPRTDREIDLLRYVWRTTEPHASYERLVSGPGLHLIYRFLREAGPAEPDWLAGELAGEDPSAAITRAAISGRDPVCEEALRMFCALYGAEAGNLALKCVATGGVCVAGGIAPKILPALQDGTFLSAFTDKGRFAPLMREIRVNVVLDPHTALLGAAHFALRL